MRKQLSAIELFVNAVQSMWTGLRLTLKHFFQAVNRREQVGVADDRYFKQPDGVVTNLYPYEAIPVPDNGRYRLHNEIEDCIVCDLCAKICPVNCIDIEPIKSPEEIGKTSDGSTKRIYAARFDIDMAKCCYCGLCTTVCPTECLTMTKTYDFSEYDVRNMVYHFAELSPDQAVQKKAEAERKAAEEKAKKAASATENVVSKTEVTVSESNPVTKPAFKPKIAIPAVRKPDTGKTAEGDDTKPVEAPVPLPPNQEQSAEPAPNPVFKPKIVIPSVKKDGADTDKPADNTKTSADSSSALDTSESKPVVPKPVFKPKIVIPAKKTEATDPVKQADNTQATSTPLSESGAEEAKPVTPKPVFKPKVIIPPKKKEEGGEGGQ